MTVKISTIAIEVLTEQTGIRLRTDFENVFLQNQAILDVEPIVQKNFEIVRNVLAPRITCEITSRELEELILKIVLQHFCLYNKWRELYPRERNRDLTFMVKDLDTPMTYDAVVDYIKPKYKKRYRAISALILGIDELKFQDYERGRDEFMARR